MALTDKLTAIANAIRAKTGKTAKMTMAEMVTEIGNLSGAENDIISGELSGEYTNDSVSMLNNYALAYHSGLTSVSFPNVSSIPQYAFAGCSKLAAVNFPKAVQVRSYAFQNNIFTSAVFPLMQTVENDGFYLCSKLKMLDLGQVTSIGSGAFYFGTSLSAVILRNTSKVCTIQSDTFSGSAIASGTGYIYVPDSLVDSYKAATNWSTYAAQIKPLSEYTEA